MTLAALNAAEMIRGHVEVGLNPEDVDEDNEQGLEEYKKACIRISKHLEKIAMKYEND